ncbi:hypothetical protein [Planomonospora algeriensis]
MRICLLVPSVYGMRGDVRSVVNLAGELAERHDVEIVSVRRHRERPFFPVGSRVRLSWVVDARPGVRHLLPAERMRTEVALWRRLRGLRADVLITTGRGWACRRPGTPRAGSCGSPGSGAARRCRDRSGGSIRAWTRSSPPPRPVARSGADCWAAEAPRVQGEPGEPGVRRSG